MSDHRPLLLTSLTSARLALWLGIVGIFVACSTAKNAAFTSLANNGIVPVSSDNPYMGTNIFLAKEMEESNYLYNFMKERGAPQAIEVVGKSEESAEIQMFYSAKQEVYTATPRLDPQLHVKEWIVRGPYAIDRLAFRQVSNLPGDSAGVFEIFGRREVLGGGVKAARTRVIAPAYVPTPKPVVSKKTKDPAATSTTVSTWSNPTNFDQQAIAESRGLAVQGKSLPAPGPAVVVSGTRSEIKTTESPSPSKSANKVGETSPQITPGH